MKRASGSEKPPLPSGAWRTLAPLASARTHTNTHTQIGRWSVGSTEWWEGGGRNVCRAPWKSRPLSSHVRTHTHTDGQRWILRARCMRVCVCVCTRLGDARTLKRVLAVDVHGGFHKNAQEHARAHPLECVFVSVGGRGGACRACTHFSEMACTIGWSAATSTNRRADTS